MISKLKLIVVGRLKNSQLRLLAEDYQKRIKRFLPLELVELKDSDKEKEGIRLLKALEGINDPIIVLTEEGKSISSRKLSEEFQKWEGCPVFVIGGPDGLIPEVKNKATLVLSLSAMTFTHEMAQMLLQEQIFRSLSIIHKTGYHRD
jgi:23S rRNA (pseudouridine1915-N3)-methyltransferase